MFTRIARSKQLASLSGFTRAIQPTPISISARFHSSMPQMDDYESKIYGILQEHFDPKVLSVRDVSGGCGSMFAIQIESTKFKGIPMVKQHRLVNELLKDEISKWHGLQLKTKAVKE